MKSVRFCTVYNKLYLHGYGKQAVDKLMSECKTARDKYWVTKHLLTICKTQSIGNKLSEKIDLKKIKHANNISKLKIGLQIRGLQHKVIEHLYKPHGTFYEINRRQFFD